MMLNNNNIIIIILYLKKVSLLVKDYSTKRPSISHNKYIQYDITSETEFKHKIKQTCTCINTQH